LKPDGAAEAFWFALFVVCGIVSLVIMARCSHEDWVRQIGDAVLP